MQLNLSQAIGDYFDNVLSKEKEEVDDELVFEYVKGRTPNEFMRLLSERKSHKKPEKKSLSDDLKGSKK
jgi:hypothetical protein